MVVKDRLAAVVLASAIVCAWPWVARAAAKDAGAKKAPCKYEQNCQCATPGITARWKAAYCMVRVGSGDLEDENVQACLAAPDPEPLKHLRACDRNAYWRKMACRVDYEGNDLQLQRCLRDEKMIPAFVKDGAGGSPQ
jgi:hypothetical protein